MNLEFSRTGFFGGLLLWAALGLTAACDWPGLHGPFLFDDTPNLSPLSDFGGVTDFRNFLRFTLGGTASPLGRPLAMASFLIDDNAWPSDPYSFKRTNLLLHLLCGIALFCFLRELLHTRKELTARAEILAAVITAFWLVHPIQQATVYLVVQRMEILSALFTFAGLTLWLRARQLAADRPRSAAGQMIVLVPLFTALATLSKETGALLPLLILVTERTLAPLPPGRLWRWWRAAFLYLPTLAIVVYLAYEWPYAQGYAQREFTLGQRLLTEPGILLDYLHKILLPPLNASLFYDDYPFIPHWNTETGALILLELALVLTAYGLRRRAPGIAFGVLFFFAAHALEAGPLPLELYFLHRNYVPMVGALWLAVLAVDRGLRQRPLLAGGAFVLYLTACASLSALASQDWGSEGRLVNAWYIERPASQRASAMAANYWSVRDDYAHALTIIDRTLAMRPRSISLNIGRYYVNCLAGHERPELWPQILDLLPQGERDNAAIEAFQLLADHVVSGRCKAITLKDLAIALDKLKDNPRYHTPLDQVKLNYALATVFLGANEPTPAAGALEQSLHWQPTAPALDLLARIYLAAGEYDRAQALFTQEKHLNAFEGIWGIFFYDPAWRPQAEAGLSEVAAAVAKARHGSH